MAVIGNGGAGWLQAVRSVRQAARKFLAGALSVALVFQPVLVQAQIIADPNAGAANRPTIGSAPNGVPLVDIATPNGRGLSHNKYHDFNIGASGVILNNHNGEAGLSRLGGVTPGNVNLRQSGSAAIILNEVTSGNRSALQGPAEVFGRQADVIIANPNGITCNGCGFINTPRATLTTGVPQFGLDGSLSGFDVRGGDVTFGGNGANFFTGAGSVDILDVVSRAVKFDGPVAGHDVGITAGTGRFDYASREMKALVDIAGKPEYAIDGSALGALQADRIKLVATEKGVGVRMRNDMAANAGEISLSADGKIRLNNVSGRDGVRVRSGNESVTAGKTTSKKDIRIEADKGIMLETVGAAGDLMVDAGRGLLSVAGDAIAGGDITLATMNKITASQVAAGGDLSVYAGQGMDMLVAVADRQAILDTANGDIVVKNGVRAGGGALNVTAQNGSISAATLISFDNMTLRAGGGLNIAGNILAQGDIKAGAAHITAGGVVVSGMDMAASQQSADGALVLNRTGKLALNSSGTVNAGQLISGGAMLVNAGGDIRYNGLVSYNTVDLRSDYGTISLENRTVAAGDITLAAQVLDLSHDRAAIQTAGTLTLNADILDVSDSSLVYGGIVLNSKTALNARNSSLVAVMENGGSGNISITAPAFTADGKTVFLAANDLMIDTGRLDNSGQLAAGGDFILKVSGDAANRETGLIYAGGNGSLLADGNVLNEFGAILAGGDLLFSDRTGSGRSLSLTNKAGLIQAGEDLVIRTEHLTNEADGVAVIAEVSEELGFGFEKPVDFSDIGGGEWNRRLIHWIDKGSNLWGQGYKYVRDYRFYTKWQTKDDTNGTLVMPDGNIYKAFTWRFERRSQSKDFDVYTWNDQARVTQKTVTQYFKEKPTKQGLIQSGSNMVIDAGTINNLYSAIEAGGDALITAQTINNVGVTLYKNTYTGCKTSGNNTCYAYYADGSRNAADDIANGTYRHTGSEVVDSVSALIRAGGVLDIKTDELNNTAAEGSISGSAKFEEKTGSGNPLDALKGMTAGGALFAPNTDMDGLGRTAPRPDSGGFGGTLPGQDFLYETRADFIDVGKYYGSSYYLSKIGYTPDSDMLFLGDSYFENQLIDRQMRDLVGQGLGKGSFVPGSNSIEQMKNLLETGADYAQANGIVFGEPLTAEQAAALDKSMVIYVRQSIDGREVYAPVLYVAAKDRAGVSASGAMVQGGAVNIDVGNIVNSGLISSSSDLRIKADDILAGGGGFAADGNVLLASAGNIRLDAGHTSLNGVDVVMSTQGVSAGGTAILQAERDVSLSGVGVKAGDSVGIFGKNVTVGAARSKTANGSENVVGSNIEAGKDLQIKADRNVTVEGSRLAAGDGLALSADNGDLTIGSAAAQRRDRAGQTTTQQKSEITSGGSMSLSSGKNIAIAGSDVDSGGSLGIQAGGNVAIVASQDKSNTRTRGLVSSSTTQQGSSIRAADDIGIKAGENIVVGASNIDAGGNIGLAAQGDITVTAMADETEQHLKTKRHRMNSKETVAVGSSISAGGNVTAVAGEDGNLNIIGSTVGADGTVGLKAGHDVTIANAENSYHQDAWQKKKGGFVRKSSTKSTSVDVTTTVGSDVHGGEGVTIVSGNNTTVAASDISAGNEDHSADLNIRAGGNIVVAAGKDTVGSHSQSSKKGFLKKKSGKADSYDETAIGSSLGAAGDVNLDAGRDIAIVGSDIGADENITIAGSSVSVIGAQERHTSSSEKKKSGLGVGSGDGFHSAWGKKSKQTKSDSVVNSGSQLAAGENVTITARESDVNVIGSDIIAGNDIDLSAARDVNITPGRESHSESTKEKRSGFGIQASRSNSGASVGIGFGSAKNKVSEDHSINAKSGLSAGQDININAGRDANLQAADVAADRDVNIHADRDVNLLSANDESNYKEMHENIFAGVTASVGSGLASAVDDIRGAADRIGKGGKGMEGIANITIGGANGYTDARTIRDGVSGIVNGGDLSDSLGISGSVSAGFQHSKTTSSTKTSTPVTTAIDAGRAVAIEAEEGNIHGVGVDISAGSNPVYDLMDDERAGDITLKAGKDITLESAQGSQSSKSKSNASGAGVGIDMSGQPMGNGYIDKSKSKSDSVWNKNSHVTGSGDVVLESAGDTGLRGAVVKGGSVTADIGGNLNIESRLDTEKVDSTHKSSSGGFGNNGGSLNATDQKGRGERHTVPEQSGIVAGEGGFDITVADNTGLKGGIISSEATPDNNRLETGTISWDDVDTGSDWSAKTKGGGVTVGTGKAGDSGSGPLVNPTQKDKGHDEGSARSAVSPGEIVLNNPDDQHQNLGDLNRDVSNTNDLIDGLPDLQKKLGEQLKTQEDWAKAAQNIAGIVKDIADSKYEEARRAGDKDGMAFWGEGGAGRAGLHGIGGGLLGGVNGVEGAIKAAIGAGAGTILGPEIKKVVDAIVRESGLTGEDAKRLSDIITSGIIVGTATGAGGTDAGGYAGSEIKYNYLSNRQLEELRLELEACDSILCSFSTEMKWTAISMGQDGSFTAGMVAGVPVELYDAVKGIVQMATNPGETYDALKSLFNSDDVLGQLSGALKESYIERIDRLKSEYERAGASGSFNAGVETGKLLTDLAALVTGVGAAVKGTTSVAGKVITKTVGKAALKDAQNVAKEAAKNAGKGAAEVGGKRGIITQYGPLNKGPLSDDIAKTFRSGTYNEVITTEPTKLYRVIADNGNPAGGYWTRTKPKGPLQSVIDSALDQNWGNSATRIIEMEVPAGMKMFEGKAASQRGLSGGGNQIYFDKNINPLNKNWIR